MEIQSFFLAEQITQITPGRYDVRRAVVSLMACGPETCFPYRLALPLLAVLRREQTAGELTVSLWFDLVDEDGRSAGLPRRCQTRVTFLDRRRFLYVVGNLDFEFPGPGRYRLDVSSEDLDGGVYHYALDMMPAT